VTFINAKINENFLKLKLLGSSQTTLSQHQVIRF